MGSISQIKRRQRQLACRLTTQRVHAHVFHKHMAVLIANLRRQIFEGHSCGGTGGYLDAAINQRILDGTFHLSCKRHRPLIGDIHQDLSRVE